MSPAQRSTDQLLERVQMYCDAHGLLSRGERVGIGFSGGADSLCLLHLLVQLGRAEPVVALHVDHGLQDSSGHMAATAAAACAAAGIPFEVRAVTVDQRERREHGLEAAARTARYGALSEAASEFRLDRVALGHTADDRAETLLLNLMRGSGLDGLAAMRDRSGVFVRPLLEVRRAETRAWCEERGLRPVEDPHNTDPALARARVRSELLPLLEDLRPGSVGRIAAAAARLESDADLLADLAGKLAPSVLATGPGSIHFDLAALSDTPRPLAVRVVRSALGSLLGAPPPAVAIEAVLSRLAGSVPGTPLLARIDGDGVTVLDPRAGATVPLPCDGVARVLGQELSVRAENPGVRLEARLSRPGDRIRGDARTVADRLARLGVNRIRRDRTLLVLADGVAVGAVVDGIGWIGAPDAGVEVRPEGSEAQQ